MDKLTDFDKKQYINILSGEKNYRNIKKTQGQLSSIINKIPKKFYRDRSLASGYEIDNIIKGQKRS